MDEKYLLNHFIWEDVLKKASTRPLKKKILSKLQLNLMSYDLIGILPMYQICILERKGMNMRLGKYIQNSYLGRR